MIVTGQRAWIVTLLDKVHFGGQIQKYQYGTTFVLLRTKCGSTEIYCVYNCYQMNIVIYFIIHEPIKWILSNKMCVFRGLFWICSYTSGFKSQAFPQGSIHFVNFNYFTNVFRGVYFNNFLKTVAMRSKGMKNKRGFGGLPPTKSIFQVRRCPQNVKIITPGNLATWRIDYVLNVTKATRLNNKWREMSDVVPLHKKHYCSTNWTWNDLKTRHFN